MGMKLLDRLKPRMSHLELRKLVEGHAREVALKKLAADCESDEIDGTLQSNLLNYCRERSILKKDTEGVKPIFTALHYAPNPLVAEVFLMSGADINQSDETGFTPLHVAATAPSLALVLFLLRNGADANALTKAKVTACHASLLACSYEVQRDEPEKTSELISCCDFLIPKTNELNISCDGNAFAHGESIIKTAASIALPKIVEKLLIAGAQVPNDDFRYQFPHEPIMHAAAYNVYSHSVHSQKNRSNSLQTLELLLKYGGNPNERLRSPRRYLIDYVKDDDEAVKLLLTYGARKDD